MTPRWTLHTAIVVGGLATLVVAGCATTGPKMGSGNVIADRQRLMKLNGASWKDIQDKAKAGNIEAIAVNAETLALNADHIPAFFPQGSLAEKSAAKPEIWQKWGEFEAAAKNMKVQAEKLRDAAKAKDATTTQAIVKDFGKSACGTCHTPFRVPPKKQG